MAAVSVFLPLLGFKSAAEIFHEDHKVREITAHRDPQTFRITSRLALSWKLGLLFFPLDVRRSQSLPSGTASRSFILSWLKPSHSQRRRSKPITSAHGFEC
ncbi:hypothetical protein DFH08DRAFT_8808 [Mycena albidolilacea]|uniref:Uncharacterized protein n=1 Tax=Mycena albidolilacea TaxID=1033008 RepID=A0AAD7F497_9AGAR|nr:hypothetical protein DFH08DRAFT_8808 [Mycena albidolilacea]